MAEGENQGEFLKLQGEENQAGTVSDSRIHQEGIDHIKATQQQQQAPAPSNPGSDDPSAGIAEGHGGVSSTAYIGSPVPTEQKSVVQSTVDTVRSYLPASLAGLTLGGGSSAAAGGERTADAGSGNTSYVGGVVAAATAATSAATAAVVGSGASKTATPGEGSTTTTSAAATSEPTASSSAAHDEEAKADSANPKDGASNPRSDDSVTQKMQDKANPGDGVSGTSNPGTDESVTQKMEDKTVADDAKKRSEGNESGEGDKARDDDAPHEGSSGSKKDNWPKENRDAIPTAGGERLGEKHWGESSMVPDVPKNTGEEKVSSAEGQPDSQTKDNTAANTGGATGGPTSSSHDTSGDGDGEGKQKFTDKIKDKLNIGKKE